MASKTITCELVFSKSTKNTHRFDAAEAKPGETNPVDSIYVQKSAMPTAPASITLTIKEG